MIIVIIIKIVNGYSPPAKLHAFFYIKKGGAVSKHFPAYSLRHGCRCFNVFVERKLCSYPAKPDSQLGDSARRGAAGA